MGKEVELVAVRVMAVTTGLLGLRSNENTTFSPFFSNAVMLGIPPTVHYIVHTNIIICTCSYCCITLVTDTGTTINSWY